MAEGFHIAEAYVTVSPDTDGFYEKLKSDLEGYDIDLKIPVSPDLDGFEEKLQAGVRASRADVSVPVDPDAGGFAEKLQAAVDAGEAGVHGQGIEVPVEPDAVAFDAKLSAAIEQARVFVTSSGGVTVPVTGDGDLPSFAKIIAAAQSLADTDPVRVPVKLDPEGLLAQITAINIFEPWTREASQFNNTLLTLDAGVLGAGAAMEDYRSKIAAAAQVAADATDAVDRLSEATVNGPSLAKTNALIAATSDLATTATTAGGRWGFLSTQIDLFGGAGVLGIMKSVAAWHLLGDVVIEFSAVAIPALIALGAFGVAAAGDIGDMYTHFENVLTVTDAMRENMAPLTGGLTAMQNAVKPEVYELAGEAIGAMSKKLGVFQTLATGTGQVLDQLGARAEVAFGAGMSVFLSHAVNDLRELGNIGGNVFGIIGNLLKSMPGYAQPLENVVQGITGALETITGNRFAQGTIKLGLAFHGAAIYMGLAATAAGALVRGGLSMVGTLAEKAGMAALSTDALGEAGITAGTALMGFSASAAEAAALPWGWILAAAAGLGFLAYKFFDAGDAADAFNSKINSEVAAAPLSQTLSVINDGLSSLAPRLSTASSKMGQLSGITGMMGHALAPVAPGLNDINDGLNRWVHDIPGLNEALGLMTGHLHGIQTGLQGSALAAGLSVHDYEAYKGEIATLSQQSITFRTHLAQVAVQFGGTAEAMGILTAAGITNAQMTSKSAASWAEVMAQVVATATAYKDMGQTGGVLGADMNALTIDASEQVTAMQKVNQAWDGTIGIISGGQNSFITFQQDLLSVNEAFQQTGGSSRTVTNTFAAASAAAKAAGASMTGLNAPSLQLRSTWQSAYGGAESLIDSLRTMSSISPGGFPSISQAMRDSIGELKGFGAEAPQTRSELVTLAEEIKPNITNWAELTKWLGNTKDAGANLNKILTDSGVNLQDLAADAGKLSASMQTDVADQFDLDRLKAGGASTAINNLAAAMSKQGATARSTVPQQDALYYALIKSGLGAKTAQTMIEAMTGTIFKIPKSHNTALTASTAAALKEISYFQQSINGLHGKTITISTLFTTGTGAPVGAGPVRLKATGGVIPGYAPGRDTVPAILSPGEGVLVPEAVRGLGGAGVIDAINRKYGGARVARGNKAGRFASGGVTGSAKFAYPNDEFIFNISNAITAPPFGIGVASKEVAATANLTAAVSKITAEMASMKAYAANITSNLASSTGLGAISAPTNAAGKTLPITGSYIKSQLQHQLYILKQFYAAIGQLYKDKLGKMLIGQVVALGPDEGLIYARAILAGGKKLSKELATIENEITGEEKSIGKRAAEINAGQNPFSGWLKSLKEDKSGLTAAMKDGGKALADEVRRDLARLHIKADVTATETKTKSGKVDITFNVKDASGKFSPEEQAAIKRLIAQAIAQS